MEKNRREAPPVSDDEVGIKVLREAPENASYPIDIVAIHGLGAHPDQTWTKTTSMDGVEVDINWLIAEPFLPSIAKEARIMRFGYKSAWFGKTAMDTSVRDIAGRLLKSLGRKRKDFPYRPLIFIAHCFGGLVVLKASVLARNRAKEYEGISQSTVGVLTLGTPFRGAHGMKHSVMLAAALEDYTEDQVRAESLNILQNEDETLKGLLDEFSSVHKSEPRAKLSCFYETGQANPGKIVGSKDRYTIVVTESSGCLDFADRCSISRNHFNINKFAKPTEDDFENVRDALEEMIEHSSTIVDDHAYISCKRALYVSEDVTSNEDLWLFEKPGWLFEHESYTKWNAGDLKGSRSAALLSLRGNPGTGKTVLLTEIAKRCIREGTILVRHSFGDVDGRKMPPADQLQRLYKSLLCQLLNKVPKRPWSFLELWKEAFEAADQAQMSDFWTVNRTKNALKEVMLGNTNIQIRGFRILIDALDVCTESFEVLKFIDVLLRDASSAGADIRICICRRHHPDHGDLEPETLTIIVEDQIEKAVQQFIKNGVGKIKDRGVHLLVYHRLIRHRLREFEWPKAVLERAIRWNPSSNYEDVNKMMDAEFLELAQGKGSHKYEFENVVRSEHLDSPDTILLLQIISAARLLMTPEQVRQALAFVDGSTVVDIRDWENSANGRKPGPMFESYLRKVGLGLLEVHRTEGSDDVVRFVFPSVEGNLRRIRISKSIEPSDWEAQSHSALLKLCLRALKNCWNSKCSFTFLEYAWEHWVYHARQSERVMDALYKMPNFVDSCVPKSAAIAVERHLMLLKQCSLKATNFLFRAEELATTLLKKGDSMLIFFATHGCTSLLKRHLNVCVSCRKIPHHLHDGPFRRALDNAVSTGCNETAEWLAEQCESVGIDSIRMGSTALYHSGYYGATGVVTVLLRKGANLLAPSKAPYRFPLHMSVEVGRRDLLCQLLGHNANADVFQAQCGQGKTVLHAALGCSRKGETVRVLLDRMPSGILENLLTMKDKEGSTPLDMIEAMRRRGDSAVDDIEDDLAVKRAQEADERETLEQEERKRAEEAKTEIQVQSIWGLLVDKISGTVISEEEIVYPVGAFWD